MPTAAEEHAHDIDHLEAMQTAGRSRANIPTTEWDRQNASRPHPCSSAKGIKQTGSLRARTPKQSSLATSQTRTCFQVPTRIRAKGEGRGEGRRNDNDDDRTKQTSRHAVCMTHEDENTDAQQETHTRKHRPTDTQTHRHASTQTHGRTGAQTPRQESPNQGRRTRRQPTSSQSSFGHFHARTLISETVEASQATCRMALSRRRRNSSKSSSSAGTNRSSRDSRYRT